MQAASDLRRCRSAREFLQTVWYECKRAGLDVAWCSGLIQVESSFRKFARQQRRVRAATCRSCLSGHACIGDGDASKLFHMQTNLRFGCVILRHYLDRERGDLFMALGALQRLHAAKPQYPERGARRPHGTGYCWTDRPGWSPGKSNRA